MVSRKQDYARLAPGWLRKKDGEIYVTEDDRFKAIRGKNQSWLLVTDRQTNRREIADSVAELPAVRKRMEAFA